MEVCARKEGVSSPIEWYVTASRVQINRCSKPSASARLDRRELGSSPNPATVDAGRHQHVGKGFGHTYPHSRIPHTASQVRFASLRLHQPEMHGIAHHRRSRMK